MSYTAIIGYVHGLQVDGAFIRSLTDLLVSDRGEHVLGVVSCESGPMIHTARNMIAQNFLQETKADYFMQLDADMSFNPDLIDRLVAVSRDYGDCTVAGLYFAFNSQTRETFPLIYTADGPSDLKLVRDWPRGTILKAVATGAGATLFPRRVLEKFPDQYIWPAPSQKYGEDQLMWMRLRDLGEQMLIDTTTVLGHSKRIVFSEADYDMYRGV